MARPPREIQFNLDDDDDSSDSRSSSSRYRSPIPPEPWFYGFMVFYIKLGTFLGFAALLIVAFVQVYIIFQSRSTSAINLLYLIATLIGGTFVLLTWTAVMSLLLDAAKNLRKVRYNTER